MTAAALAPPAHGPASRQLHHACAGPGLAVLCFLRHDTLEYFSVYGTALSMWVSLMGEWPPPSPGLQPEPTPEETRAAEPVPPRLVSGDLRPLPSRGAEPS